MNDLCHAVAVHEAGHAVIARVLDVPVAGVRLNMRRIRKGLAGTWGETMFFVPPDCADDELAEAIAVEDHWKARGRHRRFSSGYHAIALAKLSGGIAERELCGRESAGTDHDEAELDPYWPWIHHPRARLERMASTLVRRHADKIERVVARLLAARRVGAAELDSLLAA